MAATTVDELQVLITANTSSLQKELQSVKNDLNNLTKNTTKCGSSMTKSFILGSAVTKVLSTAIQSVTSNIGDAITRLDTLNNYTKVMSNLGVSTDDAEASVQKLSDKLLGLPTTLDDAVSSVQRFTSANGNVKASTDMFLALNNAILAGGASSEIQSSALEQLSQAYAKGKPDMMEWRTAMTAMPAQLKQVALAMGYVSADALGEDLRDGTVSMNDFMKKINELNTQGVDGFQSFEEQAKNSTGGVATSITNVKTAFTRGLANIMDAIGQSNIAGFFQGIAKAINNVVPYITGFVKVCVSAVNYISRLFGKKTNSSISSTKSSIDTTTSSMSSLGSSASSTADDLDDTTSSAKNLSKQLNGLASFDEMNVLSENTSSSSDSDSASDLGDWDLSGWDDELDDSVSKADEIADKLRNTFSELWASLSPIIETIGNGLKWLYDNVLVPLGNWTINDLIPAFLNLLSGAFKVLNPLLKSFGTIFSPIWENLLKPLLSWTGSTIVDILNGIGYALTTIGDWMNKNQTVVDTIVASLTIFFGLWKVTELMAFIQMSGSLTAAFTLLTSTIWKNIAAKIADKAETIAITALYAKDFVVSIVSGTAALIKNAAQWVINTALKIADTAATIASTAATIAATAATWLFNAALAVLTSPITLVIVAIGLLVAGIVLLIKHWDDVKEVASNCWEKIKSVWNDVASWFNSTVVQPVADFFDRMWDNLKNGASNAWNGIKSVFSTVGTFFKDTFTKAWTSVKNVFSTGGKIFDGIKDGIVSAFKSIVNGIIKGINKVVSIPFNGINNALKKIRDIDILGAKPFKGLINTVSVPQIPQLAKGGVVDQPTYAMIGEAGKEAVMPLENNTGWMDDLADKLANKIGNGNAPIYLTVKLGEDTIFNKFVDFSRSKSFETNGEVFSL